MDHVFQLEATVVDEHPEHVAVARQDAFGICESLTILTIEQTWALIKQLEQAVSVAVGNKWTRLQSGSKE